MPARLPWIAAALLAAWSTTVAARDLTIAVRGAATQAAMTDAYARPFADVAGFDTEVMVWEGGIDALRERFKTPDAAGDLFLLSADELATGCAEGLFEKLDWPAIGGKEHYQPAAVSECGVGGLVRNVVLAWDRDKFPVTPTWTDFWDVAKYPGKRGLARDARGAMEIALLADGVAPGDVYKVLASKDGADRAFQKLDQLKPYIVWWQTGTEAARILDSGDVLMTSAPSGAIATAARQGARNFGIQWAASLYQLFSWAIPKGNPNLRVAQQFLYFTGMPAIEARLVRLSGQVGLAKGLNDGLPPELQAISPTHPPNLAAALKEDTAFWHDNQAKLRQRFDAWFGK